MNSIHQLVELLDPIVWQAHFLVRLPERRADLVVEVPVSRQDWSRYWRHTKNAARGYWHGATGLIAERLGIDDQEWKRMVRLHMPKQTTRIGDSSHDYSYLIQNAAVPTKGGK